MMCWSGKSIIDVLEWENIVDVLEWENIVDVLEREKHRWCAGVGKTSLMCWRGKNIVGVLEWEIVVGIRDGVIPVCCRGNWDVLWWDAIL
ncbi:hypothetical protein ACQXWO_001850 [Escherichia coli]